MIKNLYADRIPDFLVPFLDTPEMKRLKNIGMNCGCEYTNFSLFKNINKYSRFDHSLGVAILIWNYTKNYEQSIAGLFHDIASPVFSHTIDFLNNDYIVQESTEVRTEEIIKNSKEIIELLTNMRITVDEVKNYHIYTIADNDIPKLSADRLEYTIGNLLNYNISSVSSVQKYLDDIVICINETNETELGFKNKDIAVAFAFDSLKCSKIYVSDEDRYSMQILSEILRGCISTGILTNDDLYTDEVNVMQKIMNSKNSVSMIEYMNLSRIIYDEELAPIEKRRIVPAKRRYIDPIVRDYGRVRELSNSYNKELCKFLALDQNKWICGI